MANKKGKKTKAPEHTDFFYEAYKNTVPSSIRMFGESFFGDMSPINEEHFSKKELKLLREVAEDAESRGKSEIGYGDYKEEKPWASGFDHIKSAIFDPGGSMANTLGMADISRDEEGNLVITDMYDFAASAEFQEQSIKDGTMPSLLDAFVEAGPIGPLNLIGNKMLPKGEGRPIKIKLPKRKK